MFKNKANNFAFIDSQNLNLGIRDLGWRLDYKKFRQYLANKYQIKKAYMFIGLSPLNQRLYASLQEAGFVLIFKPTIPDADGNIKGNVDADLVLQAMLDYPQYDQAIIVSSDGDFYSLARYLYETGKLLYVMAPSIRKCSSLLKQTAKERIISFDRLRGKLEYKKRAQSKDESLKRTLS